MIEYTKLRDSNGNPIQPGFYYHKMHGIDSYMLVKHNSSPHTFTKSRERFEAPLTSAEASSLLPINASHLVDELEEKVKWIEQKSSSLEA